MSVFTYLFVISCSTTYNKEEAIRSLKVLNSDMFNFMAATSELPELSALKFLYNQPNAPIPFKKPEFKFDNKDFSLLDLKGTYVWDSQNNDFYFESEKDFIDMYFQNKDEENVNFKILQFESEIYNSKPDFPIDVLAKVFVNEKEKLVIKHQARISDGIPEFVETIADGGAYKLKAGFKRTEVNSEGELDIYCTIQKGIHTIVDIEINSNISYSLQSFYHNYIQFEGHIFNHRIIGEINYKNIDPTSIDYAGSFNRNAKIEIFESSNVKVGDIILVNTGFNDMMEFQVKFKNNDKVLLKEYVPIIEKLYNLKY